MNNKVRSDEVPKKFTNWLIMMGCPLDKIPEEDKVAQMCIGQYYMVWRNLLEHIQPKDSIHKKRMQVFLNDIITYKKKIQIAQKIAYSTCDMPEQLSVWNEHKMLSQNVSKAENRISDLRRTVRDATDKVASKVTEYHLLCSRLEDAKRRMWLLQRLSADLATKVNNIQETKSIADSLCLTKDDKNVETKLDKCIALRKGQGNTSANSSIASHSVNNDTNELNDLLVSLSKCNGGEIWAEFCKRRAALLDLLSNAIGSHPSGESSHKESSTPQSVLFHTTTLQCTLGLETIKNNIQNEQTKKKCDDIILQLSCDESDRDMVAERAQRAQAAARAAAFLSFRDQLRTGRGVFEAGGPQTTPYRQKSTLYPHIGTKKNELKKMVCQLSEIEQKMFKMRECLVGTFGSFSKMSSFADYKRGSDLQFELPKDKITLLCQYYLEKLSKYKKPMDLSFDLGVSDCSIDGSCGDNETFVDELKMYLNGFNLSKNRKLVLDNGLKIWISESLRASLTHLLTVWRENRIDCNDISPFLTLSQTIKEHGEKLDFKTSLEKLAANLETPSVNLKSVSNSLMLEDKKKEEKMTLDKIKKRINECLNSLQKVDLTLGLVQENLTIWSRNDVKKYVSQNRTVDGKTYKQHEISYLELRKCLKK